MDRVRGASARATASVRERPHVPASVPEALCRWDWRPKVSGWVCLVVVSRGRRGEFGFVGSVLLFLDRTNII